jgi:hypothetical protein
MSARSGIAVTAAHAAREFRRAEKLDARRAFDGVDAQFKSQEAANARADGARLLVPPARLVGDARLELAPAPGLEQAVSPARMVLLCTLDEPNVIAIDASEHRAEAASRAGVLSPALDAAKSAGADNSLEKMMAHQVAATHHAGMDLLGLVANAVTTLPPVERARLTNAAARMFDVSQSACLTLQRLKTGGTQTVTVQHVNVTHVAPGGQAVVAGRVEGGRGRRGGPKK